LIVFDLLAVGANWQYPTECLDGGQSLFQLFNEKVTIGLCPDNPHKSLNTIKKFPVGDRPDQIAVGTGFKTFLPGFPK
jgi:hypothetical protein